MSGRYELLAKKAVACHAEPGDLVFPTQTGKKREFWNSRVQ